jgi:hypothetical protein
MTRLSFPSAVALIATILTAAPVVAQGTYASAHLTGDLVRLDRVDIGGQSTASAGGEALGFALRLGTPIGRMWGAELDLTRPAVIETESTPDFLPLTAGAIGLISTTGSGTAAPGTAVPGVVGGQLPIGPIVPSSYRIHSESRYTTLSTSVWAAQELSSRVSLVYLGGVGFHRSTFVTELTFERRGLLPGLILPPTTRSETLVHSVRPLAGFEARIGLTDHVQLVPGVRMHGIEGGWLIRPSVGLGWKF